MTLKCGCFGANPNDVLRGSVREVSDKMTVQKRVCGRYAFYSFRWGDILRMSGKATMNRTRGSVSLARSSRLHQRRYVTKLVQRRHQRTLIFCGYTFMLTFLALNVSKHRPAPIHNVVCVDPCRCFSATASNQFAVSTEAIA